MEAATKLGQGGESTVGRRDGQTLEERKETEEEEKVQAAADFVREGSPPSLEEEEKGIEESLPLFADIEEQGPMEEGEAQQRRFTRFPPPTPVLQHCTTVQCYHIFPSFSPSHGM